MFSFLPGKWRCGLFIICILGLVLRVSIAWRDIETLDRLFVPDDTYYTLAASRALASGLGPTVDGTTLTNGFQPLLAFLLVPVFMLTDSPDMPLRATILLMALFDCLTILLLAKLASRLVKIKQGEIACAAAALWACSPVAIANALGGLETALALACSLGLVELWCRAREKAGAASFICIGICAGACLLARIDTAFIIFALGCHEILFGNRRGTILAGFAALLIVSPWWLYEFVRFGSVIPESGMAVHAQTAYHQSLYLTAPMQIGWALGTLLGPPFIELASAQEWFFSHSTAGTISCIAATFGLILIVWRALKNTSIQKPVLLFMAAAAAMAWFYILYVPALWFFRRYFAPMFAVLAVLYSWGCAELEIKFMNATPPRKNKKPGNKKPVLTLYPLLYAAAAAAFCISANYLILKTETTIDSGLHGAKGYRKPALQILALAPPNAVIGALQSGALSYYARSAGKNITVVNLDGVVDAQAARAFQECRLAQYAEQRGVTHFADWMFNAGAFMQRSTAAALPSLKQVGMAELQAPGTQASDDRMLLFEVSRQ